MVKEDLNDFGIEEDLVMLQQMSKGKLKKLIKAEARKYAFNELKKSIKGGKGHSTLKDIRYTELKITLHVHTLALVIFLLSCRR